VAENAARNQMEYVFTLPYLDAPGAYSVIEAPRGFTVTAQAEEYVVGDPDVQKVVVTAIRDARNVLVLETVRFRQ
jgi:hypothetical protein